jgi:hypothetical protein
MPTTNRGVSDYRLPLSYPEVAILVNVLGLLHPGANAEWLFSNDKGEPPAPLGLHIGDTSGDLDITIETSQGSGWVGVINSWRFAVGSYVFPCSATVAALAMQIASAAVSRLQNMATQAAALATGM